MAAACWVRFWAAIWPTALGVRDKRWYLWLPAIAGTLALPLGFPYLLLADTTVVIGFMFLVTIMINTYLAPALAISHTLVPPAMRALTSAVLFFVFNMIGLGLGPLTVGLLSDFYVAYFGDDSLRYAMLTVGRAGFAGGRAVPAGGAAPARGPGQKFRAPVGHK